MPPVPFLLNLLHMFPFWTAFVTLPFLFPVPHLLTVLVQAEAGTAKQLEIIFVSQPGLGLEISRPAGLFLRSVTVLHLPVLNDVQVQLHDGVDKGVFLRLTVIRPSVLLLQATD